MASGLLKYIGRPIEPPPKQEDDDALNERVKARMERMGMVEIDPTRRRSDQVSANRLMIADRARVTPRSLRLTRGTSLDPVTSDIKAKKPKVFPLQRSDSLPGTTHYPDYDNVEGGPFDTDAENLDSTTNISDGVDDVSISRSWHEGDGDLAVISRHSYPADSEYQDSLLPLVDQDVRQGTHIEEDFTDGDLDEVGLSENGGGRYQNSIDGQPQYGLQAMQDLVKEQRQNTEQSPVSTRTALDAVMGSPSIQQSLAYRNMTARRKHSKAVMPSLLESSNQGPMRTLDDSNGGAPFLQNTEKATTIDMNFRNPAEPEDVEQIARDIRGKSPVSLSAEQQSEQPQQRMHEATKTEPFRASQQRTTQMGLGPSLRSQGERQSPRSVSFDQQILKRGFEPAATAEGIYEGNRGHSADLNQQQSSKVGLQSQTPSLQGRVETQTDIAGRIPVQAKVPKLEETFHSKILLPDNLDGQHMGKFGAPEPPPAQSLATGQSKPQRQKRSLVLDYNPSELSRMAYKFLQSESFDHVPRAGVSGAPNEPAKAPLAEKVQRAYDMKEDSESQSQRQGIFSNLTIEQYEEAGDLLLEKFANVIGGYKEARQTKRKMAKELEKEIARREEIVRTRISAVERELTGLKHAGRKVVRGQYT